MSLLFMSMHNLIAAALSRLYGDDGDDAKLSFCLNRKDCS